MKIGLVQMTSVLEPSTNLEKIKLFLQEAKKEKAEAVFLPEVFYSMSNAKEATPYLLDDVEATKEIGKIAKEFGLYLLGGSAATKKENQVINRSYNFDPAGNLIGTYDKKHLFAVNLSKTESKTVIDESDVYTAGSETKVVCWDNWTMGMCICFDLRFPEMFRHYYSLGVNLFTVSSAFTVPTGKAHWETLLRARAIENQAYVVASAQWGEHNEVIKTYGHSMVIDPWGSVIANAQEGEKIIFADIDVSTVQKFRERMKVPVDNFN